MISWSQDLKPHAFGRNFFIFRIDGAVVERPYAARPLD